MTPHDLLLGLGKANLAAAGAILAVMALRKPARRLFGPGTAYGLWTTPALAAAAVLAPARTVSVVLPPVAATPAFSAPPAQDWSELPIPAPTPAPIHLDLFALGQWAWIAGIAAMALWLTLKQLEFLRAASRGEAGPAVVGFLRPRIVTPADFESRFTVREQSVVLAHERTHLLRQDARINALIAATRCLCWFNPLVHVAAFLMRIDQELACDAAVVARHPKARRPYAEAMLKAEFADRPLPLGCFWPAGTQHPLTERIAMLKLNRPSRLNQLIGGSVLTLVCGGIGVAAWASQPAQMRLVASPPSASAFSPDTATSKPVQLALAAPSPHPQPQAAKATGEVDGNVIATGFAYPNLRVYIRDAGGQDNVVTTEAPTPWDVFSGGIAVSVRVYASEDGALYADLADFTSNGARVVPQAVRQPNLVRTLEARAALCGTMPSAEQLEDDGDPTGKGWIGDCSAKVVHAEGATKGAGGIPSFISNSVKREGTSFSDPPPALQPALVQHGWRDTAVDATIRLSSLDWSGEKVVLKGVDDQTGQVWLLTAGSANVMRRAGVQPDQASTGMSLKVLIDPQGGPARCARACSGVAREIQFPDGTKTYLGGPGDPRRPYAALPAGFLDSPPPGWHAFASLYDANAPLLLTGRIVGIDYSGPYVQLRVKADALTTRYALKGVATAPDAHEWVAEFGMVQWTPAGFRSEIQAGDKVSIRGYAAKDGRCEPVCRIDARDVTALDTGHKFSLITPPTPSAPARAG